MSSSARRSVPRERWTSLWVIALASLIAQLWLCQFFTLGTSVPMSIDIDPSNLWKYAYTFPPTGSYQVVNWLGIAFLPFPLNPCSLAANLPAWTFFTTFAPLMATGALLAMTAFLRELDLPRPAALFGGVIYAWQGDILSFVLPGHYSYITTWLFFALAAWGALRAERTGFWAYAVVSGASTGLMVGLQPDRGAIASLLIAALYIARFRSTEMNRAQTLRQFGLCVGTALLISLAAFLALFKGNIVGVTMGGKADRNSTYQVATQYSLGPEETLTYLVPGVFGWHSSNPDGMYWGRVGRTPNWPRESNGTRNFDLAISTTGTVATLLALLGITTLVSRWLGPTALTSRQRFYGVVLLVLGTVGLILSWGYHTPFYRPLYALPLMDKWRNPLKWLELTNFALVVFSAYGMRHVLTSLEEMSPDTLVVRRRLKFFCGIAIGILGLGVLITYPYAALFLKDQLLTSNYDPGQTANIMATLIASTWFALLLSIFLLVLLLVVWKPEPLRLWKLDNPLLHRWWHAMLQPVHLPLTLAGGMALLCVGQLAWVHTHFIQPTSFRILTQSNPLIDKLRSEGDTVRVAAPMQDMMLNILLQNQFYAARISCLDISAASRIPVDFETFLSTFHDSQSRLWFLAGVKNVVVPQEAISDLRSDRALADNIVSADGYSIDPTLAPDTPSHAIVQLRDYLAKATLVPGLEILDEKAMLQRLKNPAWNPRETVLLNAEPKAPPVVKASEGGNDITLKTYTPHDIEIDAQSATGGYVLINDQYDPDWSVQVNGQAAELLRADYILRAVAIPAGTSHLRLHYTAHYAIGPLKLPALAVNLFSDTAMLAAWALAGWALWRRRSAPRPRPT